MENILLALLKPHEGDYSKLERDRRLVRLRWLRGLRGVRYISLRWLRLRLVRLRWLRLSVFPPFRMNIFPLKFFASSSKKASAKGVRVDFRE